MKFPSTFQIIPVLDLMGGVAVHAIAGRRHEYREVDGVLGRGADPVALAMAMTRRCGTRRIYVADLDAIGGLPGHLDVVTDLVGHGLDVWLDAGIAGPNDAMPWLEAFESLSLVLGLETLSGHEALTATRPCAGFGNHFRARGFGGDKQACSRAYGLFFGFRQWRTAHGGFMGHN